MFLQHALQPRILQRIWRAFLVLCCWLTVSTSLSLHAQSEAAMYQKKAEFISSITRFVDWPDKKFVLPDSPFVIGVYGADNISDFLREAIQERRIKDRPVVIKHLLNKEELRSCHVLFISRSEHDRLGSIFGEVRRENVLTIGESDNFLSRGGAINLITVNGTVRFQVNLAVANREKLVISSKLLQLALPPGDGTARPAATNIQLSEAPPPRP